MSLERELAYYAKHKLELLKVHPGKFLLIKGEELVGAYDTASTAYSAGVAKYGLESFLVKRVLDQDEVYRNYALCLGLMHAQL